MADEYERKFIDSATLPKFSDASSPGREPVSIMVSGSNWGIKLMIYTLFKCGFAEVDAWSKPQQIPNSNRLMSVMTKYINKSDRGGSSDKRVS